MVDIGPWAPADGDALPMMSLLLLALSLTLGLMSTAAQAAAGTIQAVVGSARIIQANGQERAAIKGDHLYAGDTVTTGAASNVQIRMIDDARIWLRAQTRFKIEQYPSDAPSAAQAQAQASTRLIEGSLRTITGAIGQAQPQHYRLKTPNAVIGIRGTEFEAAFFGPGQAALMQTPPGTYHRVHQGFTALLANGAASPLALQAGQAAFVGMEPGDAPRPLPQIPPFLNLSPTDPGGPATSTSRPEPSAVAAQALRVGLRVASPLADGAEVRSSRGAPIEPTEAHAQTREGDWTRLTLSFSPPPSSRQRRSPEPPSTVVVDLSARLQPGRQALVQIRAPGQGQPVTITLPLGTWTDISGRGSWLASERQTISSGFARPESAQVLIRVDPSGP